MKTVRGSSHRLDLQKDSSPRPWTNPSVGNRISPDSAAILLHLDHITALARGGTAEVVAVAIRKYRKLRLILACNMRAQPI